MKLIDILEEQTGPQIREFPDLCFCCEGTIDEHEEGCPCAEVREPKTEPTSSKEK